MKPSILSILLLLALVLTIGCQSSPDRFEGYSRNAEVDDEFARGTDRKPSARTLQSMARILGSQYQDEEARYILERCIASYPRFAAAYCDLAELHIRNGRLDLAVETLEQGRRAVPTDAVIVNNLGMCHLLEAEYEAALALFEEAVELDPDNTRYTANRAMTLGLLGEYEQALEAYRGFLTDGEAHYNLAILYEANRENPKADEHYRRAESLGYQPEEDGE